MVVSSILYPVLHHFPVVFANIIHRHGNGRPIFITAIPSLRRPPTDQTRALEVVALEEEPSTFERNDCGPDYIMEVRDRYFFPS
jgi:hypothetical protein